MKYLSLDTIDITNHTLPPMLSNLNITMRGTKNLFNIFFSAADVEVAFGIDIPPQIDFTWVNTPSGKDKYISYPTLKRLLYQVSDHSPLVDPYLAWVDGLLFSNSKVKPFFRSVSSPLAMYQGGSSSDTIIDTISNIDDTESILSYESVDESNRTIIALRNTITRLEHALAIKDKDMDILERDIQIRDRDIEILQMKLHTLTASKWV